MTSRRQILPLAGVLGALFAAGFAAGAGSVSANAEGSWVLNHCNQNAPYATSWSRANAQNYALTANGDGYDWGGGCWNSDGTDNTPNQNDEHNSVGEGADCSGFTFKSWGMPYDQSLGRVNWSILSNNSQAHGPYTAASFKSGVGAANALPDKAYSTTNMMDAFASSSHIGMIYAEGSGGSDTIVEAKDQQTKMGVFSRTYRSQSEFSGVKRAIWDPS